MSKSVSRTVRGLAVLGAATLALAACGPATSGEVDEAEDVDVEGVEPADEITFWTTPAGGSADVENELVEESTAETGITVNVVTSGANYEETSQRFQTAQGSAEVDVVVLSDATWFPNYLNGSLVAVDGLLEEAGTDASGYGDALYEDYRSEERRVGTGGRGRWGVS